MRATLLDAARDAERAAHRELANGLDGMTVGPVILVALARDTAFAVTVTSTPERALLPSLDDVDRHALAHALERLAAEIRPERTR